jgi:hypothetical protein
MKVIHSRISVSDRELTGSELLVWYLSVLQWKRLGYTTKIYVDDTNLQYIKDKKLYDLYDEVDSTYFNNTNGFFTKHDIDKSHFWASSKIFLLENETEPCIVSDHDFIPFAEIPLESDIVVYHVEKMRKDSYYDYNRYTLAYNTSSYSIPEWFTFEQLPFNTSICYINNEEVKKQYIEEAYKYTVNNFCQCENPSVDMIYIEQRFLSELCNYLNISTSTLINLSEVSFINERYFHMIVHKDVDNSIKFNNKYPNSWHIYLLDKLNKYFPEAYETVINMEEFSEDKEYIEANGFDSYKVPMPLRPCKW